MVAAPSGGYAWLLLRVVDMTGASSPGERCLEHGNPSTMAWAFTTDPLVANVRRIETRHASMCVRSRGSTGQTDLSGTSTGLTRTAVTYQLCLTHTACSGVKLAFEECGMFTLRTPRCIATTCQHRHMMPASALLRLL